MTNTGGTGLDLLVVAAIAALAALSTTVLIHMFRPWLERYALARPNARSSHREPTPQGGGAAVVISTLLLTWLGATYYQLISGERAIELISLTAAVTMLAAIGVVDDVRGLPAALPKRRGGVAAP